MKEIDYELLRKRREKILRLRSESNEQQHIGLGYVLNIDESSILLWLAFLSEQTMKRKR